MSWIAEERERARKDGVHHRENFPFLLTPEQPNGQAVVLVHGFGATPRSIFPVARALYQERYTVAGVRLPGHGTSPADLKRRKATEWITVARSAYDALAADGLKISGGGLSTGALVALTLASQRPLHKLLLFSPFLRLRHHLAPFAGFLSFFVPYQKSAVGQAESDFYYSRRPLKAIGEINRLLRDMPHILPQIKAPTLVLTSTGDATIAPGTALKLYERLGSPDKILHTYGNNVPHVLTTTENPELNDVLQRCLDFMNQEFSNSPINNGQSSSI
ncbi:alpha/beta hydrolase [Pelovirga terrestris]|uniref:Alpha/beta fold hydrolase n=1 Tax=Pelovirga terrestris TaxID=2771352 RepID=A0A8J6QRP5_9BACT|nr:alpha/beta fold hydrolase [Pelovirga terrestris]MBD1401063.1 alpha/beta fold hydrolase [Pelovirga terrestris]